MDSLNAVIFDLRKLSTDDGPGLRTVVCFKGCASRCLWCQNPEAQHFRPEVVWQAARCRTHCGCVDLCPHGALSMAPPEGNDAGAATLRIDREQCTACAQCVAFCPDGAFEIFGRAIGVDELLDLLIRDQPYYEEKSGGVTLSGGEPLAQADAVLALLRSLNRAAIHVALRTCGMAPSKALNKALDHVDLVLFELSLVDAARHGRLTGIPFGSVEEAARLVNASGVPVWVRTPVVAGYTDDEEDIRRLGEFVAQTFEHCERHELRAFSNRCTAKYHRLGRTAPLGATDELSAETMRRLCAIAREAGSLHAHWAGPMVA